MLRFLQYRHCPEGNPPHEVLCNLNTFFQDFASITISILGITPTGHFYVHQAQPVFTAYRAVFQK